MQADAHSQGLARRRRRGALWRRIFQFSTVVGLCALALLMATIVNDSFGYVAWQYRVLPDELSGDGTPFAALPADRLAAVIRGAASPAVVRRLELAGPLETQPLADLQAIALERAAPPHIEQSYTLLDTLLHKDAIRAEWADEPRTVVSFYSWVNHRLVTASQSSHAEQAGVRTALLGSIWTILITMVVAVPMGVGAAVYLEEYAPETRMTGLIQTNINNLAGVPSIIYGMLGLTIFVRALAPLTSGQIFGMNDGGTGRTILSAALTLAILILPLIIINAQEAIRSVPDSLRNASLGLGATRWQTVRSHVLPAAMPGILTGTILAMSRAIGETAPLVVIGAATFIAVDPSGPFSGFTTLPIQIYQWISRPQDEFRHLAAAAILVLLVLLLSLNAVAIILRNKYRSPV